MSQDDLLPDASSGTANGHGPLLESVSVPGFTFLRISQQWWTGHRHIRREPSMTAVNDANGNHSASKRARRVHLTTMGSRRARVDRSSRLPQAANHTLTAVATRVFLAQSATPPQHPYQRSSRSEE